MLSVVSKRLFCVCLLACCVQIAHAQLPATILQQLPDAATPGGQVKRDEFLYPELEPEPGKYIVPPVVDRPLGDTEGPRIKIEAIELRGAVDRPEKGLLLDDVWKVIEEDRAANPDGHFIGQLQALANRITDLYREKGFIVAHAFVPVQTVEDGIVTIQVLEGVLGRILVEGHKIYKPEILSRPFGDMLGEPLHNVEVESALIRLTDYPGLTSFGVFQAGQEIGESDLVLKVQEEKSFDLVYSLNNHGSRFTGQYLSRTAMGINNMFGQADRFEAELEKSVDPGLATLLSFEYSQQIYKPQYRIEVGRENSDFGLDERKSGIEGITSEIRTAHLRFRNKFERGRLKNAYWMFGLERKTARTFQEGRRLARDHLAVFTLEYGFDALDIESQSFSNLVIKWDHGENAFGAMSNNDEKGSRQTGDGDYVGSRFDKLSISYANLATLSATNSLLFRLAYQYTSKPLLGLEQFALGGPDSVRAYPISEVTMDRGFFLSAEHIWNAPGFADKPSPFGSRKWGEVLTVSQFADWAYGERLNRLDTEENFASYKGWGVAAQLAVPGSFTAKLTAAWPMMDSPIPSNKRRPQIYASFETELF